MHPRNWSWRRHTVQCHRSLYGSKVLFWDNENTTSGTVENSNRKRVEKSKRQSHVGCNTFKPHNVKPLSSQLVFKLKLDADGGIERYKARLVARGDQQVEGVNYQDTFSPVMDTEFTGVIRHAMAIFQSPTHEHRPKKIWKYIFTHQRECNGRLKS